MEEIPDYLVCVDCESPTYVFEWRNGKVFEAICELCGAEDPDGFLSQEDYEDLVDGAASAARS